MRSSTREKATAIWWKFRGIVRTGLMTAMLSLSTASCQAAEKGEEVVAVEVLNVSFDHISNSPVVILQDKDKTRGIPIWVGSFEAQAIAMEMQGVPSPRPLTHDLLKTILQDVGVQFEKAVVSELKDGTYYSRIYLTSAAKHIEVDSRPSDAIALALRFHKPIFVVKSLLEGEAGFDLQETKGRSIAEKVRGITVQDLTEKLAAYFDLAGKEGVLVSGVTGEGTASGLKRGDVILAVGDQKVHGAANFKEIIAKQKGRGGTLRVLREGKEIVVGLAPEN